MGVTHAGMATDGKDIYYAGGYITNARGTAQIFGTKAVWRYNVALDTYTPLADLPENSAAGQLEYLAGKLHYFGGTNSARTSDLNTHYVLDLNKNGTTWVPAADLLQARNHLGSAVLDGVIYAIGGQTGHDEKLKTLNTVEAYDPVSNRWEKRADMPQALSHTTNSTFVLNGRIVVAGGETAHDKPTDGVTAYDPRSNTWTALTPLPQRRVSGVAAPLGDGFVFTGGNVPDGGGTKADGWRASPVAVP
ncbi:Kelch repeat-containing protein [Deinococcus radiopugnans]|uniref:Kelch repeat-containing protein n=1 Tax=Deinococcus radiopugnans TaxID=57497 RepID=UPI003613C038